MSSSCESCSIADCIDFILSFICFILSEADFCDFDALPDLPCCKSSEDFSMSSLMSFSSPEVSSISAGFSKASFLSFKSLISSFTLSNSLLSWSCFSFKSLLSAPFSLDSSLSFSCFSDNSSNFSMVCSSFCSNSNCLKSSSERSSSFSKSRLSFFMSSMMSRSLFLSNWSIIFCISSSFCFISSFINWSMSRSSSFCFSIKDSFCGLVSSYCSFPLLFSFLICSISFCSFFCFSIRSSSFFLSCQLMSFFSSKRLLSSSNSFCSFCASCTDCFILLFTCSLFSSFLAISSSLVGTFMIFFCEREALLPLIWSLSNTSK